LWYMIGRQSRRGQENQKLFWQANF
jgi:hypothetical protein